jgi:hypothetical protein
MQGARALIDGLIGLQSYVVLFIALHDWTPLGALNDVRAVQAADSRARLVGVTVLSTLPFACGLGASLVNAAHFPRWLIWYLWISYGAAVLGMLRAWWLPYLLFEEPARAARYQAMFGRTHAFLPLRHGIRPNTLHVSLHAVIVLIIILLALLTRSEALFAGR